MPAKKEKKEESFVVFLIKLVVIVFAFRSFIFSPFNIPSESMLPRLLDGDYLLAAKWPYGYSRYSLPFNLPLIPGRIFAHQPARGDVVIFKAPANNEPGLDQAGDRPSRRPDPDDRRPAPHQRPADPQGAHRRFRRAGLAQHALLRRAV